MTDNRLLEAFRMFTDNELLDLHFIILRAPSIFGRNYENLLINIRKIIEERGI
jgi:hypothetical protein